MLGQDVTCSITPATGFALAGLTDNNIDMLGVVVGGNYLIPTVSGDHTLTATFSRISHALTLTISGNGSGVVHSSPEPDITCATGSCGLSYPYGTSVVLTALPNTGSSFAGWNGDCNGGGNCSPTMDAPHSVGAAFALNSYNVTATAGSNGTISGPETVNYGGSAGYTITPAVGYHVADVLVDGISVGPVLSYTFSNVTATHTISVSFAIDFNVTTTSPATGYFGISYSQTLAASGGRTPYIWSLTGGTLPAGLTMSSAGVITGIPTAAGTSSFTIQVIDANNTTASKTFSMTVNPPISIVTSTVSDGYVGSYYSQTLTAAGGRIWYRWTVTGGTLPAGLTLGSSGGISGTPTAAGASTFTVQVKDANNTTATATYTLTVYSVLQVGTTSLPAGYTGVTYSQTIATVGGKAPFIWSLSSGSLPAGLSLSSAGVISGTPTTVGTVGFTVRVTDSNNKTATRYLSIVTTTITVSTSSLAAAYTGVAYNQTLAATGGLPPYNWSVTSGSLPAGLSLSSNGVISGAPAAPGTVSFTVQVVDANNSTASKTLSIVTTTLSVSTTSMPTGYAGVAYSRSLAATGGKTPYTWTVTGGSLPAGLTLSSGGVVTGAPTSAGTSSFTVQVTDANNTTATKSLSIAVTALSVTTTSPATGYFGVSYSQTLAATGGRTPYIWSVTGGSLPAGLTLSSAGIIAGVPTAAGTSSFTVQVIDTNNTTATKTFSMTVNPPLSIVTSTVLDGYVGSYYTQTLTATGGRTSYTWSVIGGTLPAGLTLSSTGGTITGTPTTAGPANITIQAKDYNNTTTTATYTLTVYPALQVGTTSMPAGNVGVAYSQALATAGGKAPFTWAITAGSLPAGLAVSSEGVITGTPTTTGSSSFTVRVTDANNKTATRALSIVIQP